MVNQQSIMKGSYTHVLILGTLVLSGYGLLKASLKAEFQGLPLQFEYWLDIWGFTLWQAGLSTVFSVILGSLMAWGFAWRQGFWRTYLLPFLSLCFVLPQLVIVMMLVKALGRTGWLSQLGMDIPLFGLTGILMAHLFMNAPFIALSLIQRLEQIPNQERLLAKQLGLQGFSFLRWVIYPHIGSVLTQSTLLVFLLCCNSFAIILSLGGGPESTTLEVAVYQSLKYDFDPTQASWLALMQCLTSSICAWLLLKKVPTKASTQVEDRFICKSISGPTYFAFGLFLCGWVIPLLMFALPGFQWLSPHLWLAPLIHSVGYAVIVCSLSLTLCLGLLLTSKRQQQASFWAHMGLIVPTLVLTTGLTLAWYNSPLGALSPIGLILWVQAIMILPYLYRSLFDPWNRTQNYYASLNKHLGLSLWQSLRWVYFPVVKPTLLRATALSMVLVMGDVATPALLGYEHFPSLSVNISQSLSAYRFDQAYGLAILQFLITLVCFVIAENFSNPRRRLKRFKLQRT
jgi:thiamine transport system permease protein